MAWTRELGQPPFSEIDLLGFWIFDVLTWCSQRALFPSIVVILEVCSSEARYQYCRRNSLTLRIHSLVGLYLPAHQSSALDLEFKCLIEFLLGEAQNRCFVRALRVILLCGQGGDLRFHETRGRVPFISTTFPGFREAPGTEIVLNKCL